MFNKDVASNFIVGLCFIAAGLVMFFIPNRVFSHLKYIYHPSFDQWSLSTDSISPAQEEKRFIIFDLVYFIRIIFS